MKYLLFVICFISFFSLSGNEINKIIFNSDGIPYVGETLCRVLPDENPLDKLCELLDLSEVYIREDNSFFFISLKRGEGYIPILSFHKLGKNDSFELTKERFEELLLYLNRNSFHIISDKQYLNENYTYAADNSKIIILGVDDASSGVFYYKTVGDQKTGNFIRENGDCIISGESMVYFLNKHLPVENGRRNFTFYITFDAIPFRQTGGEFNRGKPYTGMSAVADKLNYLYNNYFIGNHTLNHLYSEFLSTSEFEKELIGFYDVIDSYGIDLSAVKTLAYSYGIGELDSDKEELLRTFSYKNAVIDGAFDYNGYFAKTISHYDTNPYDISRIGVDNGSYNRVLDLLENTDIFKSRRVILIDDIKYPFNLSLLELDSNETYYILVRD